MLGNLVAIQLRAALEDYASYEVFRGRMAGLLEEAAKKVDFNLPTVVCYPETVGLWLSFVPQTYHQIQGSKTIVEALVRGIPRNLPRFLGACWRYKTVAVRTIFLETAVETEEAYCDVFSGLARQFGCYLQSGTLYVPRMEMEAVKGRHSIGRQVYNTAYLFGPNGLCLGRVPKRNLAPPMEHRFGFTPGSTTDIEPIDTPLGRLGILICYDGFHHTLVEETDGKGVQLILSPSHSDRSWERPAGFNKEITVGEAWERHGLAPLMQGRMNIQYAVVAMMAGRVLDLEGQGCSHIVRNAGEVGAPTERYLLARASSHTTEEVVTATVDLPGGC